LKISFLGCTEALGFARVEAFFNIYSNCISMIVQTKSKYAFAISGTGHCGMEAMVFNMVEPGDVVLVGDHGIWGERFADLCDRWWEGTVIRNMSEIG
jgi:aspartate aminotransferase-like enzyme